MFRKRTAALAAAALGAVSFGYVGAEYSPYEHRPGCHRRHCRAGRGRPLAAGLHRPGRSQGPAVVHISVTQRAARRRRDTRPAGQARRPDVRVLPRRFQVPMPDAQPMPRQGQGSGFIVPGRHDPHQRARRRRRLRTHGETERQARVQGEGRGRRQADRRRGAEDRGERPAGRQAGRPDGVQVGEWVAAIGSPFGPWRTP